VKQRCPTQYFSLTSARRSFGPGNFSRIEIIDVCNPVILCRDRGGDRLLNSLLTEIEKHEGFLTFIRFPKQPKYICVGIVFLATNRPYDLDEAMHRRITCKFSLWAHYK
jgi:SpoVK/Ycf46/Vps4 family AAA+-type ATPase